MLRLTKTLNLIFGYRWSVRFCEGDDKSRYLLHGDSAMQLLFHIGCMWEDKELREPWRIYLRFNKKGRLRELNQQDFQKELSSVSEDVAHWVNSIDPDFKAAHAHLAFVRVGSRRELPLGPRHSFVAGSKEEKTRSDLMEGVARTTDSRPTAVQTLDDLEDTIFRRVE
jgi:hypothetical protein